MIPWLTPSDPPEAFPPVSRALEDPDGLLCAGGDLSPARILAAYRRGIFPWYAEGQPILWWSPDPRMVLLPDELRVSRSLRKSLRNRGYRVTFDAAFAEVVSQCADSGTRAFEGTWISPEMHVAYVELHRLGHARSVEVWLEERLVGGLYGLELGHVFFGESMFSIATDASKVALFHQVSAVRDRGVHLIDCQVASNHLFSLGARLMPRAEFVARLERAIPRQNTPDRTAR
ncbi:MAG TPA: leucyl/phenylalanyl-tRNA--protein transferase [Steroidobacteraceae bacterium]|nr:leucyl/phenylalanyl-tRNA--protein transferase [Steroidobacteraceae bacterium]